MSSLTSSSSGGDTSSLSGLSKKPRGDINLGISERSLLSSTSSLAFAINRSRNTRKRQASFLGSSSQSGKGAGAMRTKSAGLSLGHVVFPGDSQTASISRSSSLPNKKTSFAAPSKKRIVSETGKQRSSLWSKVAAGNGFKKRGASSR